MLRRLLFLAALSLPAVSACNGGGDGDDPSEDGTDGDDGTDDTDGEDSDSDTDEPPDTDAEVDPCMADADPVLIIGTGEDDFERLQDGDELHMVHGPQGGWHLTGALRVDHSPQFLVLDFEITDVPSGQVVSDYTHNVAMVPEESGAWQCKGSYLNILGILDIAPLVDDGPTDTDDTGQIVRPFDVMCGSQADLHMSLKTADGTAVADETVRVIVQPDPTDAPECTPQVP